jgi:hypothetical protein
MGRNGGRIRRRIDAGALSVAAAVVAVVAVVLAAPAALASPTPSPSLGGILVTPSSSDLTESDQYIDGPMSAERWAADDTRTLDELRIDNFVAGFGRTFTNTSSNRFFFEAVAAFSGGLDAKRFATFDETSPSDDFFDRPLVVDNINSFVGGHFADTAKSEYWDRATFVKGNDVFEIFAESKKDDLGDLATTHSQRQYEAAPRYTIPPSQWPENAASRASTSLFSLNGALIPIAIVGGGILVVGLLVVALVLFLNGRGRGSKAAEPGPQMSPDGRYWWDGQAWRDAEQSAPPNAMRSADGYYWWDGNSWRSAPATPPSPAPVASLSPN